MVGCPRDEPIRAYQQRGEIRPLGSARLHTLHPVRPTGDVDGQFRTVEQEGIPRVQVIRQSMTVAQGEVRRAPPDEWMLVRKRIVLLHARKFLRRVRGARLSAEQVRNDLAQRAAYGSGRISATCARVQSSTHAPIGCRSVV